MTATPSTMAMRNIKFMIFASANISKPNPNKSISLLSIQNFPKGPTVSKPQTTIFSPLSRLDAAFAGDNRRVVVGSGIGGGLAAVSGLFTALEARADEIAAIAEAAAASDNRGQLILFVVTPAIHWVLYNILQPALNQINKMRS